ncbi:MAG: hypothetical protein OCD01_04185 [Fibrobacterales bacterium]
MLRRPKETQLEKADLFPVIRFNYFPLVFASILLPILSLGFINVSYGNRSNLDLKVYRKVVRQKYEVEERGFYYFKDGKLILRPFFGTIVGVFLFIASFGVMTSIL